MASAKLYDRFSHAIREVLEQYSVKSSSQYFSYQLLLIIFHIHCMFIAYINFKGWLCGECKKTCRNGNENGIGVLTTKCRCSKDEMYNYLVPLVGKC